MCLLQSSLYVRYSSPEEMKGFLVETTYNLIKHCPFQRDGPVINFVTCILFTEDVVVDKRKSERFQLVGLTLQGPKEIGVISSLRTVRR